MTLMLRGVKKKSSPLDEDRETYLSTVEHFVLTHQETPQEHWGLPDTRDDYWVDKSLTRSTTPTIAILAGLTMKLSLPLTWY